MTFEASDADKEGRTTTTGAATREVQESKRDQREEEEGRISIGTKGAAGRVEVLKEERRRHIREVVEEVLS